MDNIESKIVRARVIPVDELQEGMIISSQVRSDYGVVVLPQGIVIQDKHIEYLAALGVEKVEVVSPKKQLSIEASVEEGIEEKGEKLLNTRALVVDDSNQMRRHLKLILEQMGVVILGEAANGKEAVKMAKELLPDIVTMDIEMPEMDGVAAVKEIKLMCPEMKVIMVTVVGNEKRVLECMKSGAADFIKKPFNHARVKKAIIDAV